MKSIKVWTKCNTKQITITPAEIEEMIADPELYRFADNLPKWIMIEYRCSLSKAITIIKDHAEKGEDFSKFTNKYFL